MLKIFSKVDVKKPAGATPHGRVAFVRFGAESCARRARKKMRSWGVNEGKPFFKEKRKWHQKVRKVDVVSSAGATPHGHVAFVRFGAEM